MRTNRTKSEKDGKSRLYRISKLTSMILKNMWVRGSSLWIYGQNRWRRSRSKNSWTSKDANRPWSRSPQMILWSYGEAEKSSSELFYNLKNSNIDPAPSERRPRMPDNNTKSRLRWAWRRRTVDCWFRVENLRSGVSQHADFEKENRQWQLCQGMRRVRTEPRSAAE